MINLSSEQDTSCLICGSSIEAKLLLNIKKFNRLFNVFFCGNCKTGFTIPILSAQEFSDLYSPGNYRLDKGKRFNSFIEALIKHFRLQRRMRIKKYTKKGRILDIGCGRGLFLDIMREEGWEVMGIEFDERTASHASESYGIEVHPLSHLYKFKNESCDVITLYHSLEHSLEPSDILTECFRILKKGGLLVIAVPNIAGLQAIIGGRKWFHLDVPYHTIHFTEAGLVGLLHGLSFDILNIKRFDLEYSPFGWLQTLLNLCGIRENFLYHLLKNNKLRKKELSKANFFDVIATLILSPFFLPLSFILSVIESAILKKSGIIEVYAVKR